MTQAGPLHVTAGPGWPGWTWIDYAPWGFAPFPYGRWAHHHGGWYWVPGAYIARPIYAPALVAFIGGRNWGLSFGFGFHNALAWFPLGPREFWYPHYHASHTYIRNLNITHVNVRNVNITNYNVSRGTYVNRAVVGAVTAVPRDAFIGGRAVPRSAFAVDRNAVMRSEVVATSAVAPRVVKRAAARRARAAAWRTPCAEPWSRGKPAGASVLRAAARQTNNGHRWTTTPCRHCARPAASTPGPVRLAGRGLAAR